MYLLAPNVKIIKWRAHVPHSGNFIHFLYTCVFFVFLVHVAAAVTLLLLLLFLLLL